jgi:creatinine amidohydrolase/Fe(II)-dependent formamide hydrolase-like protein
VCRLRLRCCTVCRMRAAANAEILEDQKTVRHACEAETSMMLASFADCVSSDRIVEAFGPISNGKVSLVTPLNLWRSFKEITPSGVWGDARRASVAKGERLARRCGRAACRKASCWPTVGLDPNNKRTCPFSIRTPRATSRSLPLPCC